jgi:hypothetical protein
MKKASGNRRPNSFHTWWMRCILIPHAGLRVKGNHPFLSTDAKVLLWLAIRKTS